MWAVEKVKQEERKEENNILFARHIAQVNARWRWYDQHLMRPLFPLFFSPCFHRERANKWTSSSLITVSLEWVFLHLGEDNLFSSLSLSFNSIRRQEKARKVVVLARKKNLSAQRANSIAHTAAAAAHLAYLANNKF